MGMKRSTDQHHNWPRAEFRALTIFENIPPGHKAVLVLQAGFDPHLKIGEMA